MAAANNLRPISRKMAEQFKDAQEDLRNIDSW